MQHPNKTFLIISALWVIAFIYFAVSQMRFRTEFHERPIQEVIAGELNGNVSAVENPSKSKIVVGIVNGGVKSRFSVYGNFLSDARINGWNCIPKGNRFECNQSLKLYPGDTLRKKAGDSVMYSGSGRFLLVAYKDGV